MTARPTPTIASDSAPPAGVTDLDHKGAIAHARCGMCQAEPNAECTPARLGPDDAPILVFAPGPGRAHASRLEKWLEIKAQAAAFSRGLRVPNMQQLPRLKRKNP